MIAGGRRAAKHLATIRHDNVLIY